MKINRSIFILIVGIATSGAMGQMRAVAQQTNATTQAVSQPSGGDDEILFKKGEFNLTPFGTYVDQAGGKWGAGLAGTYYLTDKLGLGAATYWTDTGGTFFDNLEAEAYFRLPLFKRIAPYAVGSIGYQFDREYWFETLGAGLDFRAFKHLQAFSDVQCRFSNSSSKSGNGVFLRVGVRLDF